LKSSAIFTKTKTNEKFQQMAASSTWWRFFNLFCMYYDIQDYWVEPEYFSDETLEEKADEDQREEDAAMENE